MIFRSNFNLGLTKKPLQVRMGKGKGAPVDWVYPFAKNRMFLEFVSKRVKTAKLKRIFKKAEQKLPAKMKIRVSPNNKIYNSFNFLEKLVNLKCVKEL